MHDGTTTNQVPPEVLARSVLADCLNKPERVIYSSSTTFRKGPIYFMGHNPRGTGSPHDATIQSDLDEQATKRGNNYIAEDWGFGAGESRLQRSVRKLFEALSVDLHTVFTTNLIFFSGQNVTTTGRADVELCWRLHERFLTIVDPEILIVFGNSGFSPFGFILEKHKASVTDWHTYRANHHTWRIKNFSATIVGRQRWVFGFPHLSRYMVRKDCEGVQELTKCLASFAAKQC